MSTTEQLQACARTLATEQAIAIAEDGSILESVQPQLPSAPEQTVSLSRVHTYVYTHELSKAIGTQRIVFPSFASHWAILVTDKGYELKYPRAYHLTFKDPAAALIKPPVDASREIVFMMNPLKNFPEGAKEVGTTRFSHAQLMEIGDAMIKAFGSYHRVFWNCQHFARLYLHVITNGKGQFEEWTLGQTTNLFLCAFLITAPVATTNKTLETQKARQIMEEFPDMGNTVDDDTVLKASDEAISLAQSLAIQDYERDHPSEVRVERVGGLKSILDTFAGLAERFSGRKLWN